MLEERAKRKIKQGRKMKELGLRLNQEKNTGKGWKQGQPKKGKKRGKGGWYRKSLPTGTEEEAGPGLVMRKEMKET